MPDAPTLPDFIADPMAPPALSAVLKRSLRDRLTESVIALISIGVMRIVNGPHPTIYPLRVLLGLVAGYFVLRTLLAIKTWYSDRKWGQQIAARRQANPDKYRAPIAYIPPEVARGQRALALLSTIYDEVSVAHASPQDFEAIGKSLGLSDAVLMKIMEAFKEIHLDRMYVHADAAASTALTTTPTTPTQPNATETTS